MLILSSQGFFNRNSKQAMAYCSAMTYLESRDIYDYDPYQPCTIREFGLQQFKSYYK